MLCEILPEEISQGCPSGGSGFHQRAHHLSSPPPWREEPEAEDVLVFAAVGDVDAVIRDFWDECRGNLEPWYLAQKRPDDIIISASPEFLLRPICAELGVTLIGTRMAKETGLIDGENCHDAEKVRRFNAEFPGAHIDRFYSDSLADTPMAKLADKAFLVKRGELSPWPDK